MNCWKLHVDNSENFKKFTAYPFRGPILLLVLLPGIKPGSNNKYLKNLLVFPAG
jgi:hypothetical protein